MTDPRVSSPAAAAPAAPAPRPAPPFFQASIRAMIEKGGSDLLLKVGRPPTVRIAGELVALELAPPDGASAGPAPADAAGIGGGAYMGTATPPPRDTS